MSHAAAPGPAARRPFRRVVACGFATLDVVQVVDHVPAPDEKVVATDLLVESGGPAANAAVTAVALGTPATLVTRIGTGALGTAVLADLRRRGVAVQDHGDRGADPAVSTVLVTRGTGERAVISVNASRRAEPTPGRRRRAAAPEAAAGLPPDAGVLLVDGHHLDLAVAAASQAQEAGILVVLDGGSWKPGLEQLVGLVDVAVLSADFRVPDSDGPVLDSVHAFGPSVVAQSHGHRPIELLVDDAVAQVPVPRVQVVDTLGAGDVLHGALVSWLAGQPDPHRADIAAGLAWAAEVASRSCTAAGARGWIDRQA